MQYKDFNKFSEKVGLLSQIQTKELGLSSDSEGRFEISQMEELMEFCKKNPKYHIATLTSDGDDCDIEGAICITISNSARRVNREMFYLANGDGNPEIFLEEIDYY